MKLSHTLIALAITAAAQTAFAQSSDLSVTGKILPGACTVELGGGGIAFLGNMSAQDLNTDSPTEIEVVTLPVSVACEAPTRFAFRGIDNVPESGPDNAHFYGLGMTQAEEKIGRAELRLVDATLDSGTGYSTESFDEGAIWTPAINHSGMRLQPNNIRGFAAEEHVTTGPAQTAVLHANLEVEATINATEGLSLAEDVAIDGSVTLSLVYL